MPIDDRNGSTAASFQVNNLVANNATVTSTTQTTSPTTGALTVAGGVGIQKDIRLGGNIYFPTDSIFYYGYGVSFRDSVFGGKCLLKNSYSNTNGDYLQLCPTGNNSAYPALNMGTASGIRFGTVSGSNHVNGTDLNSVWATLNGTNLSLAQTTASASLTTGALTVAGGVGVAGNLSSQSLLLGSNSLASFTSTDDGTTNTTNISRSGGGLIFGINPFPTNDTYLRIYRAASTEYLNIFAARAGTSGLNNQYVIESVCPISGVSRPIRFRLTNTTDSNSIDALQINGSGNISIGSTNDNGAKLQVNGTAQISSTLSVQGINNTGTIQSSDHLYFSSIKEIGNVYLAPNAFKNINCGAYPYAMVPPVNRLLGADTNSRFTVSATNIASGSVGLLFDGNYDSWLTVNQNTTSVVLVNFSAFTYSAGMLAITFYGSGNAPENILIEGQNSTNAWTTLFSTTTNSLSCVCVNTANITGNYPKAFRITVSSTKQQVRLTELEWFSNRTDPGELPYLPLSYSSAITTKIPTLNLSSTTPSTSTATGALTVAGGLGVGGNLATNGIQLGVNTQSTNYSLVSSDATILANASSAAFTLTLPSAVTYPGKIYRIKKIDSTLNTVTIATTSSQTIDGAATTALNTQYASVTLVSDGTNWFKF